MFFHKGSFVSKIDLNLVDEAVFKSTCEKEILKLACSDKNSKELIRELEKI